MHCSDRTSNTRKSGDRNRLSVVKDQGIVHTLKCVVYENEYADCLQALVHLK